MTTPDDIDSNDAYVDDEWNEYADALDALQPLWDDYFDDAREAGHGA